MPDPVLYLQTFAITAGLSAFIVLTMSRRLRPFSAAQSNRICVCALGLSLAAGYFILLGRPTFPPVNALGRFLVIVLPTVVVIEWTAGLPFSPPWLDWSLRFSLVAVIGRVLLHGSVWLDHSRNEWTSGATAFLLIVSCVILAAEWAFLARLARDASGVYLPLALAESLLCVGMLIMMAGYVTGGSATLPLAAAICGVVVASASMRSSLDWQGTIGIAWVGLFSLALIGRFFGGLSTAFAVTVILAPVLCWLPEYSPFRRQSPWLLTSFRLLLPLVPLITVLILAKREFDHEMAPLVR